MNENNQSFGSNNTSNEQNNVTNEQTQVQNQQVNAFGFMGDTTGTSAPVNSAPSTPVNAFGATAVPVEQTPVAPVEPVASTPSDTTVNNNVGMNPLLLQSQSEIDVQNGVVPPAGSVPPQDPGIVNPIQSNDDELVKAFIGVNYDKISTEKFNIFGFLFSTNYLLYRKMLLFGILLFIADLIVVNIFSKFPYVSALFNLVIGFFADKMYLYFAKSKVAKIKAKNPNASIDELKGLCTAKGGTSGAYVALGIFIKLIIIGIYMIIMIIFGIASLFALGAFNFNTPSSNVDTSNSTLVENVSVTGYSCMSSSCTFDIETEDGNTEEYGYNLDDYEFFQLLDDYQDYITLNIYYSLDDNDKVIVKYEIYSKSSNEKINATTETKLREELGLYNEGSYTETFTLKEVGETWYNDTGSYVKCTFINSDFVEFEMNYYGTDTLTVGNSYTVSFDVKDGDFGYEYNITSIS